MIPPYIDRTAAGLHPTREAMFAYAQPVWYQFNGTEVTEFTSFGPWWSDGGVEPLLPAAPDLLSEDRVFVFGAKVASDAIFGPNFKPAGWVALPHMTLRCNYRMGWDEEIHVGPVDIYFDIFNPSYTVLNPTTWFGPPPFPDDPDARDDPVLVMWVPLVDGVQVALVPATEMEVAAPLVITIRSHVTSNNTSIPRYVEHTHDYLVPLSLPYRGYAVPFLTQPAGDNPGEDEVGSRGDYLDHLELIYSGETVAEYYPGGHPLDSLATQTPLVRDQITLFDWEVPFDPYA